MYNYTIQIDENSPVLTFNNNKLLVEFINQHYNIDIMTKDILTNHFNNRKKKPKPLFNNIFHLSRNRIVKIKKSTRKNGGK